MTGNLRERSFVLCPAEPAESATIAGTLAALPARLRDRIRTLFEEFENGDLKDGVIAKDADVLECLIQAHEYRRLGVTGATQFAEPLTSRLRTDAGKELAAVAINLDQTNGGQGS